jgi:hypothetical protein
MEQGSVPPVVPPDATATVKPLMQTLVFSQVSRDVTSTNDLPSVLA